MPILPAWDVEACVRETERLVGLGFRGVNMTMDPQDSGALDYASRYWDPLWAACADLSMPVHFHIASSFTANSFYGKYFWPSVHQNLKPAIGGAMHFINNGRMVINSVYAGIFDRHPKLKFVSVESGIGWIPFILEAMDYEITENAPEQAAELSRKPSEYFRDHWYGTFWFEDNFGDLQYLIDKVGEDNVLFETDFPHPTCLYPDVQEHIAEVSRGWSETRKRKILQDNAAALYGIPV